MASSVARSGQVAEDINVLPLIDVLLVLLIIAMVLLRNLIYMPAEVPPPAAAPGARVRPSQIVLELRADGSYTLNGQPIPAAHLETQLHAIYDRRPVKLLFISAADNRSYQEVISLMDLARGAGVQTLALVPRARRRGRTRDRIIIGRVPYSRRLVRRL